MGRSDAKIKAHTLMSDRLYDMTLDESANAAKKFSRVRKVNVTDTKRITSNLLGSSLDDAGDGTDDEDSNMNRPLQTFTSSTEPGKPLEFAVYPSDIWHLIARYISPAELGTFALICKDSNKVLHSVHFWRQLFHRYYKADLHLPRDLRNASLAIQRQGLRCRTIRLLYLTCPLLSSRLLPPLAPRYEPYSLQGMRLLLMWYKGERNCWNYYFRFQDNNPNRQNSTSCLYHNPEAGSRILKVTCPDFVPHQYVDEKYLCSVYFGLTSDMLHQRLTLGFGDYISTRSGSKSRSALVHNVIVLERVTKCVILDWWHPDYPYFQEPQNVNPVLCSIDLQDEEW